MTTKEELRKQYEDEYPLIMGYREVQYTEWLEQKLLPSEKVSAEEILRQDQLINFEWEDGYFSSYRDAVLEAMEEYASQFASQFSEKGEEIKETDLFQLDVKSNKLIKQHRSNLGLTTPTNRIDIGDLRMIVIALNNMGFKVIKSPQSGEEGKV